MKKLYLSILFLLAGVGSVFSQDVEQAVRERLQAFFQTYIPVNVIQKRKKRQEPPVYRYTL